MLGVLVCRRPEGGNPCFIAAFSGSVGGHSNLEGFVPPIFDLMSPEGYFKTKESEITRINMEISQLESSEELNYAGTDEEVTGFCRLANCDNLIYAIQQKNGSFRILGNDLFESNTKPAQASGAKETDASGTTIVVEVTDFCPSPFYHGKIETEDGDIDASTGEVEAAG